MATEIRFVNGTWIRVPQTARQVMDLLGAGAPEPGWVSIAEEEHADAPLGEFHFNPQHVVSLRAVPDAEPTREIAVEVS